MANHPGRAAALLAASLACAGCSLPQLKPASPARQPGTARTTAQARPPVTAPATRTGVILPFSPARLQAAAALAGRFAAAYDTWSWQQPPAAWLARLHPMTTAGLYAALTRAASTPAILAQRDAARQAATATAAAAAETISDLTAGSVTITVTISQVITSAAGTSQHAGRLAITLIPHGGGWVVYDIEPATAGNH
jgi:hypothetical protein